MTRTTAAGTEYRLAPSADGVPSADVELVIDAAAKSIGPGHDVLFVADHNHGDVQSEGAWSLALEGAYEWPWHMTEEQFERRTVPTTVHLEAGTGWCLNVYPNAA